MDWDGSMSGRGWDKKDGKQELKSLRQLKRDLEVGVRFRSKISHDPLT